MKLTIAFIRIFFVFVTVLLLTGFAIQGSNEQAASTNLWVGLGGGVLFALCLFFADRFLARYSLRAFNIAALGMFFGYLMGHVILLILGTVMKASPVGFDAAWMQLTTVFVLLFCVYLGMVLTARGAEELSVSIPFVRFKALVEKKKDVLIDVSILHDTRVLDLASSGLLDQHIVLPRFVLTELQEQAEHADEGIRSRARRALDVVKKLEALPALGLRYTDTDFSESKESMVKLVRLARLMDANILTADINRIQQSEIEGIRIINIHTLANLLKPITQTGEFLQIEIQRYGKEARQGVGYLQDGTMVVVNGAADFIGKTIKARVLSVKHTSSGRMIFCNANNEPLSGGGFSSYDGVVQPQEEMAVATKKYFAQ